MSATRRQLGLLVLLTLVWGLNWPVMKVGVSGWPQAPALFPPLRFRTLSMLLGLPVLGIVLLAMKVPLALPRAHWAGVARLALPNMVIWHFVLIVAIQRLSSGRAAILGYSMPIFAALWGVLVFGDRFTARQLFGVAAAALGIVLLPAHEFAMALMALAIAAVLLKPGGTGR